MATLLSPISTLYHHAPSLRGGLGSIFRGVDGVGARCGNGLFSTYNSPKFYLSFTILVLFILVRYPDRIGPGLVNAMIWPRILVFTSMMLRVLTPAAFGSYGAGILYVSNPPLQTWSSSFITSCRESFSPNRDRDISIFSDFTMVRNANAFTGPEAWANTSKIQYPICVDSSYCLRGHIIAGTAVYTVHHTIDWQYLFFFEKKRAARATGHDAMTPARIDTRRA